MVEAKKQEAAKGNGAAAPVAQTPGRKLDAFRLDALQSIEQMNVRWRLSAPEGVMPEDLEDGELWATCGAKKLRSFDVVEVVAAGGKWWAEVLCLESQNFEIRMNVLRVIHISPAQQQESRKVPKNHEIRFDAQHQDYTAYRVSDNVPISSRCSTWEQAFQQLTSHATLRAS